MNINVYLPDDLGQQAKEADLPFSRLLQAAVADELERRAMTSKTLAEPQTFELELEDRQGRGYIGRITGTAIAEDVYLTDDERVIVYDRRNSDYLELDDPVEELREWLPDPGEYAEAMVALGEKPVIDL